MARRGEVPFVAVPVGQSNNVKLVLGLAKDLKIPRAQALGYVVLVQELVLEDGDARTGTVKGYTAAHLAAKLGHAGNPRKLIDALKRAGALATHRGSFKFPEWRSSITGAYAAKKAEDREDWARQKAAQRAAAKAAQLENGGADVQGMSTWTSGGRPPGVQVENGQKERKESGPTPPSPPPTAGGALGASRWEWVRQNHPRPMNPRGCLPYLGALSEDDWALFRWVSTPTAAGGPRSSSRKMRVTTWDSYRILANQAFLQFRDEWQEKLRADARPKNGAAAAAPRPAPIPVDDQPARLASAVAHVLAALADTTNTEAEKERARRIFRKAWPDVPAPWEAPPDGEGLPPTPTTH